MRILLLQLKRIGDLVLTTPAIAALRSAMPDAHLTLGVAEGCAGLLPALEGIDEAVVFGRGWTPWQQVLTGRWDACLDFTGTDRSALAARLSRAPTRATFEWVQRKRLRALAYTRFIESPVRERHTSDHYGDLVAALEVDATVQANPRLRIPVEARARAKQLLRAEDVRVPYVLLHPFTARPEKNWEADRWAAVAAHCVQREFGCVITGGGFSLDEGIHHQAISDELSKTLKKDGISNATCAHLDGETSLLELAALVADAALIISTDTAVGHLAAAFQRPQIALFGPTNPFHWRPRHARALVISAAQPDGALAQFDPRMKGAPMERISAGVVCRAIDALLGMEGTALSVP